LFVSLLRSINTVLNDRTVKLTLTVDYPDTYPDDIPILSLEPSEGDLEADEVESLLDGMKAVVCLLFHVCAHDLSSLLIPQGRRKSRDGNDVYYRLASEGTILFRRALEA